MLHEVLAVLGRCRRLVDCTIGNGGHTKALLEVAGPQAAVLGIDLDTRSLEHARTTLSPYSDRVALVHDSYVNVEAAMRARLWDAADAILVDFGYNSHQVDAPERGFSFRLDGPLDMRYNQAPGAPTAADIVNTLSEGELGKLFQVRSRRAACHPESSCAVHSFATDPLVCA